MFVKELQVYSKVRCVKEKSLRPVQFAKLLATQIAVTKTKFPKIRCTGCVSHRILKFRISLVLHFYYADTEEPASDCCGEAYRPPTWHSEGDLAIPI